MIISKKPEAEEQVHAQIKKLETNAQGLQTARADACRLLAAFFYPPDKRLFLQEGLSEKLDALLEMACSAARPFVPPLQKHLQDEGHLELCVAYTRLFLGPPAVLAPPYASFYLDHGSIMGPSSVAILKLYGAAGLRLDDEFNEMPDHIAVVLEFLYFLLFRENMAAGAKDYEEKARLKNIRIHFLNKFVVTWIPRFCGKIVTADEHPVYTALGNCLDAFIRFGFVEEKESSHETV